MNDETKPDIQVIANLVVRNGEGRVLLTKYNPDVDRWWLPGQDVEPFTHPDEQARKVLDSLGLDIRGLEFRRVQSFRGRRGWHLAFDYLVDADGDPDSPAQWFEVNSLPNTMHGDWETGVISDLLKG